LLALDEGQKQIATERERERERERGDYEGEAGILGPKDFQG